MPPGDPLARPIRQPDSGSTDQEPGTESDVSTSAENDDELEQGGQSGDDGATSQEEDSRSLPSPEQREISRLRQAMHAKILQNQQKVRRAPSDTPSPTSLGARKVSPIKEESMATMSPSLEAAFESPLPLETQTASTESTESTGTVKGVKAPSTVGQHPLRTPSYPFPYVPGTPRSWSLNFHQPFTTLSPTGSSAHAPRSMHDTVTSGESTPAASIGTFVPSGLAKERNDNPQYPSPSLYDLVLVLNSEPGIEAWWSATVRILSEWFEAERATLAVPADATDIENVPWGQKATYNVSISATSRQSKEAELPRPAKSRHPDPVAKQSDSSETEQLKPSGLRPSLKRPGLEARHSFAGHEKKREVSIDDPNDSILASRPKGPVRTVSHVPRSVQKSEHPLRNVSPAQVDGSPFKANESSRDRSFSDVEFSSIGEALEGQRASIFPKLRALDHEPEALIDTSGVNRILEKGRVVTLTRDYSTSFEGEGEKKAAEKQAEALKTQSKFVSFSIMLKHWSAVGPLVTHNADLRHRQTMTAASTANNRLALHYEEYEQFPTSPWAQSPAPSPAIQQDQNENPFFTEPEGNMDEETFNPTSSSQDYSKFGQVEAIGIDKASTITHIPLIHPVLSQRMQSVGQTSPVQAHTPSFSGSIDKSESVVSSPDRWTQERRAPIAILSVLSPTVPFPQNLTHSLKLLGPHLATSFANAQQYTNAIQQASMPPPLRRYNTNQSITAPSIVTDQSSLDGLMLLDIDQLAEPTSGSVTSPSDYSSHSRTSPGDSSVLGTPGWDYVSMAFSSRHSVTGTPAPTSAADMVDSYFDAKKKVVNKPAGSASAPSGRSGPKSNRDSPPSENMAPLRMPISPVLKDDDDDALTPKNEPKPSTKPVPRDEHAQPPREQSGKQVPRSTPSRKARPSSMRADEKTDRRGHSLLHSYGADFSSSFQSLPAAAASMPRTPGSTHGHTRSTSFSDPPDMPPPSERLLRTIIDSLPVQIFTAAPNVGNVTWVNSKYLVYRGQDSRQVLQDPWRAVHPDDRDEYTRMWNKSLRTGQQLQLKLRLQRFDGHYRWFYVRAAPLKDKRQNIVHWIGTNMDFHDQHLAEMNAARQQETAASEAKYRALANSSPQVVFAVTKSKGVIFCNTQWETYSGQTAADAAGLGFMDYVHPDDLSKCRLPTFEDGDNVPQNVPTTLPPEPQRSKSHSESVSESSEGSMETGRTITSPGGVASPPGLDIPQRKLSKLTDAGILKAGRDADGRPTYSTEVRFRSKDGIYRWHLCRILLAESVIKTDENDEETWYGTATDINDHKVLEQTLKETMDAKSRFLSNMSHEIRTPLNGITGMVNFLIDSSLTAEQMEHVNIIRNSTEGLRDLINDILDLSKVEAGMINLSMDWLHVRSLIEEVNDLTSAMAIGKGLELNYLVAEDVPSMVKGDRFRIRQVLLNVIGNAIKFTSKGEVFVRCQTMREREARVKANETMLLFEVIDTGSGFTEKEAEYLFKRFSQIDASSTRQHGGTGLGLAISMQLVELHGGKMTASSTPGQGSTFTFTIKFNLPSDLDLPPQDVLTPGLSAPNKPGTGTAPIKAKPGPSDLKQSTQLVSSPEGDEPLKSPKSIVYDKDAKHSPALSSGSSVHSPFASTASNKSGRSSVSSYVLERSASTRSSISLEMPGRLTPGGSQDSAPLEPKHLQKVRNMMASSVHKIIPPMFSILVVCPLAHSREATVQHIQMTLPKSIPHQLTARSSLVECRKMLEAESPIIFTHIVLVLPETSDNVAFLDLVYRSPALSDTTLVIISDLAQKRDIMRSAPSYDYDALARERRLIFVFKPLKPSKVAVIFDPQKEREMSTDRNEHSAQQVAVTQKLVFDDLKRRLGNRGLKVLLVEDNQVNQTV